MPMVRSYRAEPVSICHGFECRITHPARPRFCHFNWLRLKHRFDGKPEALFRRTCWVQRVFYIAVIRMTPDESITKVSVVARERCQAIDVSLF